MLRTVSKVPITENRIEKLLLVRFLLPLLFRQMVEKLLVIFGSHCNISACTQHFELKFSRDTKFDTLISNLNSAMSDEIQHITSQEVTSQLSFWRYFGHELSTHAV